MHLCSVTHSFTCQINLFNLCVSHMLSITFFVFLIYVEVPSRKSDMRQMATNQQVKVTPRLLTFACENRERTKSLGSVFCVAVNLICRLCFYCVQKFILLKSKELSVPLRNNNLLLPTDFAQSVTLTTQLKDL